MDALRSADGGAVTFTASDPGYRLRIYSPVATVSIVLSTDEVRRLQERIAEVLAEDEPH